jgi:hypothetical protein
LGAGTIPGDVAFQEARQIARRTEDAAAGFLAVGFVDWFGSAPKRVRGPHRLRPKVRRDLARIVVLLLSDRPLAMPALSLSPFGWSLNIAALALSILEWVACGALLGALSTALLAWEILRRCWREWFSGFHDSLAFDATPPPDPRAWPFSSQAELHSALASPRLLADGARSRPQRRRECSWGMSGRT